MVGIALLTLVPGELGGSETYVRELLRALSRGGELDYRVLLPPVAPDAGAWAAGHCGGRVPRGEDAAEAPRGDDARDRAARAAARPTRGRGRRALPADAADPHRAEADGRIAARPPASRPAGALLAVGARVPGGRLAPVGARRRPRDHDQLVRPRPRRRAARPRPDAGAADPPRHRPRAVHARTRRSRASRSCSIRRGGGRTRTTSGCSRRSRSCGASGRSCGSC